MFAALAEFERGLIIDCTRAGMKAARRSAGRSCWCFSAAGRALSGAAIPNPGGTRTSCGKEAASGNSRWNGRGLCSIAVSKNLSKLMEIDDRTFESRDGKGNL